ncbi:hypothetical protein OEZ86_011050 [Tetradesmus obliquus]|nr:hypothetical protein OEZ86_011050 [Tetradesmus obliquus]
MFRGFHHTNPHTGNRSYKAFKFGALKPAAHAAIVEHLDQIQAGRIEVTCAAVVKTDSKQKRDTEDAKWATDAANKKLPEGKKWFLQPGLQTEEGAVRQTKSGSDKNTYAQMYPLPVLRMRYDTADNLRLRKILDPSKPQHAAILARASNTGVARSSSSSSSGSRQTKQEHRAAGVKRERSSSDQRQATAGGADAAVPRSATVETINLADEAPAPLRVGGRALAADELAVCDLAGSDDEGGPVWCVQKKQAIELAV